MDKTLLNPTAIEKVEKVLSKKGLITSQLPRTTGAHLEISKGGKKCKVTVRAKQKVEWPAVKGTSGKNHFIVLVDFENKSASEEPDYYILNNDDYKTTADIRIDQVVHRAGRKTYPVSRDPESGTPQYLTETVKATGELYEGCSFRPNLVKIFKNKWETIINFLDMP